MNNASVKKRAAAETQFVSLAKGSLLHERFLNTLQVIGVLRRETTEIRFRVHFILACSFG